MHMDMMSPCPAKHLGCALRELSADAPADAAYAVVASQVEPLVGLADAGLWAVPGAMAGAGVRVSALSRVFDRTESEEATHFVLVYLLGRARDDVTHDPSNPPELQASYITARALFFVGDGVAAGAIFHAGDGDCGG